MSNPKIVSIFLFVLMTCMIVLATERRCTRKRTHEGTDIVDCRGQGLKIVPYMHNPERITSFDISRNNISSLVNLTFNLYTKLQILNISTSRVRTVELSAFSGLSSLRILDLTNNVLDDVDWFKEPSIFYGCPNLEELFVSGTQIEPFAIRDLQNLRKITITPSNDCSPLLANITSLRVLSFAFGNIEHLTEGMMKPFQDSGIVELAFHGCRIHNIDYGTFNNFTGLKLLNLACNNQIPVREVLKVLSTSKNLRLESLILDVTGYNSGVELILGEDESDGCRPFWSSIKHLSLRGTYLTKITPKFKGCLPNIQTFSCGFNTLTVGTGIYTGMVILLETFRNIISVDASYTYRNDDQFLKGCSGCDETYGWIPDNDDHFPPTYGTENNMSCASFPQDKTGWQCLPMLLPPCLTYVKMDKSNIVNSLSVKVPGDCLMLPKSNNLQYVDISDWSSPTPGVANYSVYGAHQLKIFLANKIGLLSMRFEMLKDFSSLQILNLAGNELHNGSSDMIFPEVDTLKTLDLSKNGIAQLRSDAFKHLSSLKSLSLADNALQQCDFLSGNLQSLHNINLAGNMITSFNKNVTQWLDKISSSKNLTLDLSNNPLKCDCQEIEFIKWVQGTKIHMVNPHHMRCVPYMKHSQENLQDVDIHLLEWECSQHLNLPLLLGLGAGLCVGFVTISSLAYRYRWTIRWNFHKIRHLRKRRNETESLLNDVDDAPSFSSFVIYPIDDDSARQWVTGVLRIKTEVDLDRRPMFLPGRDDIPGHPEIDNIVEGLMASQTAIWVVCPSFFDDRRCEIAAHFAFRHLGTENNMILVLETDLERYRIPSSFVNLMRPETGIQRAILTSNEDGNRLFWSEVENFIPM